MWRYPSEFDVIVVGGGHAGCEAALASARRGVSTLLLTSNLDTIAKMSCNPAIGGIGKGHMVREIDALGGEMGRVIDQAGIQFRMLNGSKGPAVRAPRAQADRIVYQTEMKRRLEQCAHLEIQQAQVEGFEVKNDVVTGVVTKEGVFYGAKAVILSSGTFMRGLMHIGSNQLTGGRAGDPTSSGLSESLRSHGFELDRLKTGTPPRIHRQTVDFEEIEEQPGEDEIFFSFDHEETHPLPQLSCWITYTTAKTQEIVEKNINRSALFSGTIQGKGPRYCPSIEEKITKFPDKERHQIFLEPEGIHTEELYVNGISSSLPIDVQYEIVHSIIGLEKAQIMRPAYAIEYDYVTCGQIYATMESKRVGGLYFAGQLNGTTGYEEAAAQGLMAGINAAGKVLGKEPFVLRRSEAYIGVMIDDLITKPIEEPYRMFTSRAEHRLLLRQDNADLRLREYGYELGLIDEERYEKLMRKKEIIEAQTKHLHTTYTQVDGKGLSLAQLLRRPEVSYGSLDGVEDFGQEINDQIEINIKYVGYIQRQEQEVKRLENADRIFIPEGFDYQNVVGLHSEAKEKLQRFSPQNLGQASRIDGVSPADIQVLMIALHKKEVASV